MASRWRELTDRDPLEHLLQKPGLTEQRISIGPHCGVVTDCGVTALAHALHHQNSIIQEISLFGTKCSLVTLMQALPANTSLKMLRIAECSYGDAEAVLLARALADSNSLQVVCLCTTQISEIGATAIANALKKNKGLKVLNLCESLLMLDGGLAALVDALKINKTLAVLNLADTGMTMTGADSLAGALVINTGLRKLDMSDNPVGYRGAFHLANALRNNSTLTDVNISGTLLDCTDQRHNGMAVVAELAAALAKNTKLKKLHLSCNPKRRRHLPQFAAVRGNSCHDCGSMLLCDEEVVLLADALLENHSLEELSLAGNSIGDGGATHLARVLRGNQHLTKLTLHGCGIGKDGTLEIGRALMADQCLQALSLSHICERSSHHSWRRWSSHHSFRYIVHHRCLEVSVEKTGFELSIAGEELGFPPESVHWGNYRFLAEMTAIGRQKLLGFAMGMHHRLGGGQDRSQGTRKERATVRTRSMNRTSVVFALDDSVFRLMVNLYWRGG